MNFNDVSNDNLFKQNSYYLDNYEYENDKLTEFGSNPSITTETIQNIFSDPEFGFSLNNINDLDDIDSFIYYIQNKLNLLYFNSAFPEIISILETQFSNFFNVNIPFLYFLQKLKFFILIKDGKEKEADNFYNEILFRLLRESKPNNWINKHKFFSSILKKPCVFNQVNILEKYYEKFQFQLDNAIRNFLINKNKSITNPIKKEIEEDEINTNKNNLSQSNIENESTKDEFSDFEDEFKLKLCEENNENLNDCNINLFHKKSFKFNKLNIPDDEIDTSSINNPNKKKNEEILTSNNSKKTKKEKNNDDEILFKKLPILSSFKPKYAKRETIDKKIIRSFRKFIINEYNTKNFNPNSSKDYVFFITLINRNILPPTDYINENENEKVYFKSFNSQFLLWFFNKDGIKDLYSKFIQIEGDEFINSLVKYYDLSQEDKLSLVNYINNLPFIFDISLVNNINKGKDIEHIYRKKKVNIKDDNNNNKNKDNSKTTKYHKIRSRDNENNSFLNKSSSSTED